MQKRGVRSVQSLILNSLRDNKDRILFAQKRGYRTRYITGGELLEKVNKTRVFLKKEKIKKSDKVILLGWNSLEWVSVYFACILSGVVVVPLDTLTDRVMLRKIQKKVKAKAIFQDKGLAFIRIKRYNLDKLDDLLDKNKGKAIPVVSTKPNDILEIIYTSGTTKDPKGVVLTNMNITSGVNYAVSSVDLNLKLKMLNLLPLSHIFGQVYGLFLAMYFGHMVHFLDTIQPKKIVSFIKNKRINGAVVVPGILSALKRELSGRSLLVNLGPQFRLFGVGGASLDDKLESWWRRRMIIVLQGYGLTETSSIVSVSSLGASRFGSVGKIAKGVNMKLGLDNEILVKGKNVMQGYYRDRENTNNAFKDGWLKTGDVGEIKNGYLYIRDRKKDIIVTEGGLNVYPTDIESVLNGMKDVEESCVLEKNKRVHAVLLLKGKANVSSIIKDANKKLLSHQKIVTCSIWPYKDFPKTITGKIKKFIVEEEMELPKLEAYMYEKPLYRIVDEVLEPNKRTSAGSKLVNLGMDSLKRVELISELEKEFSVEIDEAKLDQNTRIRDLEMLLKERHVKGIRFSKWPLGIVPRIVRLTFRKLCVLIIRAFTKTEYLGLDNLDGVDGPVIFASNHQSNFDGPVIVERLGFRTAIAADSDIVFGIGTKNILLSLWRRFTGYFTALFYNTYPIGRTIGINNSLEFTGEMLDRGYSVIIFPEGGRTLTGKIKTFKSGVGYLAVNMGVPIVPIRIEGLYHVLPRGRFVPRFRKSFVKVGKPIKIKDVSYVRATKMIEEKIRGL